jgi:hypothetical protein
LPNVAILDVGKLCQPLHQCVFQTFLQRRNPVLGNQLARMRAEIQTTTTDVLWNKGERYIMTRLFA